MEARKKQKKDSQEKEDIDQDDLQALAEFDNDENDKEQAKKSNPKQSNNQKIQQKQESKQQNRNQQQKKKKAFRDGDSMCFDLTNTKRVSVRRFKGSILVDIREFYTKDGEQLPGKKGISLKLDAWQELKNNIEEIDEIITEMQIS